MLIIAAMVGGVVISAGGNTSRDEINQAGDQLFARLQYASDDAIVSGNHIGFLAELIEVSDNESYWQYRWYRYRKGQWLALDKPLASTNLPSNLTFTLEVDGDIADLITSTLEANAERLASQPVDDGAASRSGIQNQQEREQQEDDGLINDDLIVPQMILNADGELTDIEIRIADSANPDVTPFTISLDDTGRLARVQAEQP